MKKALCTIMVLLLCLPLCACHKTKERAVFETPSSFDTETQYEITFWAKNDTNITQRRIMEKAIEDFEALYPNITVRLTLYTDYSKIYNDVITNLATDTPPNVCVTYPDHIATYITGQDAVVPLNDLIEDEKYGLGGSELKFDGPEKSEIIEAFLNEGYIGDTLYAVPFMRSTEALYINKTYVETLGYTVPDVVTWDFVWEVSEKAMAKNEDGTFVLNGQNVMIPFIYKSTDNMLITMLKQKGYPYSDDNGNILLFTDETKQLLLEIADHAGTGSFSTFKRSGYPANFLNAGQCVFAVDSTAGATWMGCDAPLVDIAEENIVQFETVVRPVPQYDTENPQMISQGPSICVFNTQDAGEVLASWLFTQYLLTDEVQMAYAETEGYVPVTQKARDNDAYQEYLSLSGTDNDTHYSIKLDATNLLLENTQHTFVTSVFNGSASVREAAGQMIESVTKAKYRKQEVSYESLDTLYADTVSLYRLNTEGTESGKKDLGRLPNGAIALLAGIVLTWIGLGLYTFAGRRKGKKA